MELEDNLIGDVIEDEDRHELVFFQLRHHGTNFVIRIKMTKLVLENDEVEVYNTIKSLYIK